MSYCVYILESLVDGSWYYGQTNDLEKRFVRHNAGYEKYTKNKRPLRIYWSTKVSTRSEAMKLERKLKNMKSRRRVQEFIDQSSGSSAVR
ncbi:MAG: GIY-YIG nuclease family protein [Cyclobacteriaceae bacterium]|nr:GIY-YIG nuclease family protein [Cyclobacteriaceae bacterium]